jgi:hypothetical protein
MLNKKFLIFFTAILAIVALFSYTDVCVAACDSLTPKFTTIEVENTVKAIVNCAGKTIAVYFWKDSCTPSASDDCWEKATPKTAAVVSCCGTDCDDDLQSSINNQSDDALMSFDAIKNASSAGLPCIDYNAWYAVSGSTGYVR